MCPLRFILVFFSAVLAAYLAWRTVDSSSWEHQSEYASRNPETTTSSSQKMQGFSCAKMVQKGFWVFLDMATGSYLWRNLQGIKEGQTMTEKLAS